MSVSPFASCSKTIFFSRCSTKNQVDERPQKRGGKQIITTVDGYKLPLSIRQGLAYLRMRPPSDSELMNLPHVILTSDKEWDPSKLDLEVRDKEGDKPRVTPIPPVDPQNTPPDFQPNGEMEGQEMFMESRLNDHELYSKGVIAHSYLRDGEKQCVDDSLGLLL